MLFWTKEEYLKFADAIMDKPQSYYAFEVLYWCGIREGELLALTAADFDLEKGLLSIQNPINGSRGGISLLILRPQKRAGYSDASVSDRRDSGLFQFHL